MKWGKGSNINAVERITSENSSNGDVTLKGTKRQRFYANFIGRRFGKLEVVGRSGNQGKNILWECYCHACGNTKQVITNQLRKYTKSCGCLRTVRGPDSPYWQGVGDIPRGLISGYKNNATRRKIPYNIPDDVLWDVFVQQKGKCALSGIPITFGSRFKGDDITASLDRKDSSKPYIPSNIQWLHKHINMMKLDHDQSYFVGLCAKVTQHQNRVI